MFAVCIDSFVCCKLSTLPQLTPTVCPVLADVLLLLHQRPLFSKTAQPRVRLSIADLEASIRGMLLNPNNIRNCRKSINGSRVTSSLQISVLVRLQIEYHQSRTDTVQPILRGASQLIPHNDGSSQCCGCCCDSISYVTTSISPHPSLDTNNK